MRNEERKRGVAFRKRGIASNKIKRRSKAKGGTLIVWHVIILENQKIFSD